MKLIIFSDIHYSSDHNSGVYKNVQRKLVQYSELLTQKLVNIINAVQPDVAVCLGDLIEDLRDYEKDKENLRYVVNLLKGIKTPFYMIPGNHDLNILSLDDVRQVFDYEKLTYSVNLGGLHLVFLSPDTQGNSLAAGGIERTRTVSEADLKWLEKDLSENNLPVIMFFHYGIGENDMTGHFWFENHAESGLTDSRNEIKTILQKDPNLLAVFSGHQHWTKHFVENGVDYYLLGSLIEDINSDGIPDGVYFEIDVDVGRKNLSVKEHHITI